MDWVQKKLDKIRSLGTMPFLMYVGAKFLFGLGLAFLIAGLYPGAGWIFWGLVFIVVSIIFAVPVIRSVFKKY